MNKLIANENDEGRTILKFLEKIMSDVPKSRIEKAFRNKDIKINNKRISDKKVVLRKGDVIIVFGLQFKSEKIHFSPAQKNFNLIHEDENIIILDKKENVKMSEDKSSLDAQVLNYLKFRQKGSFVPSSIGRLDKVTSGLIVYAKNYRTLREMKEVNSQFKKIYTFKSDLPSPTKTNFRIKHDEEMKREVSGDEGKETETIFFFEKNRKFAELVTGRKHQIRSALSKLGFPIYGDRKYGGKKSERVFLHSYSIRFNGLKGGLSYLNDMEFICQPKW